MSTSGKVSPEQLRDFLEVLPDLLESLRAQGYGVGMRQHIGVHELIGSLVARRSLPVTFAELGEWLAPLLCSTPAQQEDFRGRYLPWLIEKGLVDKEEPEGVEVPPPPSPPPPPPKLPVVERIVRWLRTNRRPLNVSGAMLVAAAVLFIAYQLGAAYLKNEDLTQVVVLNPPVPEPTPVPTPFVDNGGNGDVVVVTPPTAEPAGGMAWDVDKTVEVTPSPTPTPPPPPSFWVQNFPAVVALTLVTPFAGLGLWHLLGRRRRRRDAERWRDKRPRYDKIKVRDVRGRVFQSAALRPIARGLRHYLSVESRQLDARSTVRASVDRGGLFTPVYGTRRALPEYLVLIDRVGFGDQLAQFNSDIVARLGEHDVYLDTYYFHGDPRRCREDGANSPQLSLGDLAARHPDHYLLIFSDGTGLMSTTTGRPGPFVEQLQHWRGHALLTPIPRLEWEYREWALEREGLKVLPASIDGLRSLVEAVNTGARAVRAPGFDETPPYPDILREQPTLWKERDEPPPHQTRRLVTHLRRYLGPAGFELLCACAVYPVMQWGVTLFLAYELLGRSKVDEALPRLLRLPWFRNGSMPQWLRRVLIRELPRARRRLVRERLEHLLLAFLEDPERGLRPRFAEEQAAQTAATSSHLTRMSERLAAWRRSRQLRRSLAHAPARSPLAEPVFLNYITANRRAEALPPTVRNKLFRRGVAAFGLRLAPAAALVALVAVAALTGLFLFFLERPTDNIYTPGAPEDLMSRLLARSPDQTTNPDFTYTPTTGQPGQSYDLEVRPLKSGAYDTRQLSVRATGDALKWLTFTYLSYDARRIHTSLVIAPDAPAGPTELLLYDGDKLHAHLPFNVTAAGQAPPQQQCPDFKFRVVGIGRDPASGRVVHRVALVSPPAAPSLTYYWSVAAPASITFGQGTRAVTFTNGQQLLRVSVGGLPAGCPNTATYNMSDTLIVAPAPPDTAGMLRVSPQSVTVCPSNPKLNDPPNSLVKIVFDKELYINSMNFLPTVNGGMIRLRVQGRQDLYEWDLSGMRAGSYTVTITPYKGSQVFKASSANVTVNSCLRDGAVPGTEQAPPPGSTGQLNISFDDQGKTLNLNGVDMTIKLVPRCCKTPPGFSQSKFVRTFNSNASQVVMFGLSFQGVPYGDYDLIMSSPQYYDARFPVSVNQPKTDYIGLKLKLRPTGR